MKSEIGDILQDNAGSPLGVARVVPEKSYAGSGQLLHKVIKNNDQAAWEQLIEKIDYTYDNLSVALEALDKENGFLDQIRQQVKNGRKILLKPNVVSAEYIEPYSLSVIPAMLANTEWSFVAAVLRWFHDVGGFSYDQMCVGEASTNSLMKAARYTQMKNGDRPVTSEAVYEGKSDDFYGGWGFYFARCYLKDSLDSTSNEDPMNGLEESMAGTYIPPGKAHGKLMVYDLNRIDDQQPSRGRAVTLPDGENFKSIILHKIIVGGDPNDPDDLQEYPGCVLINLPKLKIHTNAMFTNAIKNLGIGLYPLKANHGKCQSGQRWLYGYPDKDHPTIKAKIPHQVWIPELEPDTLVPVQNGDGTYNVRKTAGLTGTMLDIIRAVVSQDVFMLHIVDAIETVNRDHQGIGLAIPVSEGLIVAGTDVVATDLMCARYLFSNVGLSEAFKTRLKDQFGGAFPQAVPAPELSDDGIVGKKGYDCVLVRDYSIQRAAEWQLGQTDYYVCGHDDVTGNALVSSGGRLGYVKDDQFVDIYTSELYWDMFKLPWDLQTTFFSYMEATDALEKKKRKSAFLEAFDESSDQTVTYEENGKKGIFSPSLFLSGVYLNTLGSKDDTQMFQSFFTLTANPLRGTNPLWNGSRHHFQREFFMGAVCVVAMMMSAAKADVKDHFFPDITWGNGKWPSFSQARNAYLHQTLYGWKFPKQIGLFSLYGSVVAHADCMENERRLLGSKYFAPRPDAVQKYVEAVKKGDMEPFDFIFYVPEGYGGGGLPNVEETNDPEKILTVQFKQGEITWPSLPN